MSRIEFPTPLTLSMWKLDIGLTGIDVKHHPQAERWSAHAVHPF